MKNKDIRKTQKIERMDFFDTSRSVPYVCAWCNKIIDIKRWNINEKMKGKRMVSHAICDKCKQKLMNDI